MLYHLKFKFTGIKKHTVCHSEERGISSSYLNYEILVPRNDNILNKYSSIFKAKLALVIRLVFNHNTKIAQIKKQKKPQTLN
ncbi:hypothetical protein FPSM_01847 [Flavobacterium psychrophilum]|nr:hypothetical protein FPSM_01847 [Flavobacterium psychrophilum]